jgi:hypothetical protein
MATQEPRTSVVLIGDGDLARAVELALERARACVRRLRRASDRDVVTALAEIRSSDMHGPASVGATRSASDRTRQSGTARRSWDATVRS